MTGIRLITDLGGVVMFGFGLSFLWRIRVARRSGRWADLTVRVVLLTRAIASIAVGLLVLAASVAQLPGAILGAGVVALASAPSTSGPPAASEGGRPRADGRRRRP